MKKKALLLGINDYKSRDISDLRGCVNDVENIEQMLVDTFGFRGRDIRTRVDSEVVLSRIEKDWQWLVKDANDGDQLVFHFSGHGSQVLNEGDDEEEDNLDEILCFYDMDFDDPDTYLIDDQIHEWTQELPNGVKMTFLLDCCHSGTGTRSMNARNKSARGLPRVIKADTDNRKEHTDVKRAMRSLRARTRSTDRYEKPENADIVIARYIIPPYDAQAVSDLQTTASTSRSIDEPTNHVRFSGCKDRQTSADAYIDGSFQGAFSAYLRKTIENEGHEISHSDLISGIHDELKTAGFRQTPQMNPKTLGTMVFDGLESGSRKNSEAATTDSSPLDKSLGSLVAKLEDLVELLDVDRKRLQMRDELNDDNRSLVYVHGICWHDKGYSDKWFESLRPHLERRLARTLARNRHEVLWSKHVSDGPRNLQSDKSRKDKENRFVEELQDILRDRAAQSMELQMPPTQSRGASSELKQHHFDRALAGIPGLDCVDDFIKYLFSRSTRKKVIGEFKKIVTPLLERGHEIDIVSHSWGTVVALEGLHQLSEENFEGTIKNLFTVGSALSIGSVQRRLRDGAETGEKPELVENWVNLDARGDIVGGTLRTFSTDVDFEFLNLEPVGCNPGTFGVSGQCAHSSYFDPHNTKVNQDIFARFISS